MAFILLDLTLREILLDIPHDFAAQVAYTILALFIAGIWLGSRSRPLAGPDNTPAGDES